MASKDVKCAACGKFLSVSVHVCLWVSVFRVDVTLRFVLLFCTYDVDVHVLAVAEHCFEKNVLSQPIFARVPQTRSREHIDFADSISMALISLVVESMICGTEHGIFLKFHGSRGGVSQ